ncbi:MAG: protein-export chaperone SecB [Bacteroidales bacterium]
MTEVQKSPFKFKGYTIQESSISQKPTSKVGKFSVSVTPKGIIDSVNKTFQLDLIVNIKEASDKFKCSVRIVGIFEFTNETNKNNIANYFYVNSSAILFPYVRAYIAALTSLSGLKTINIPTLNLTKMGKELEQNTIETVSLKK